MCNLPKDNVYINDNGETSRDFTYIDNVIQMNLLAGTTDNPEAFGEAFNVAVGGRNTLNELYKIINDNLVEQLKIKNSSFKISMFQGMEEAIEWYIENIGVRE